MPNLSVTITYDGTDLEIIGAISRIVAAFPGNNKSDDQIHGGSGPGWPEKAAQNFAGYISDAAARDQRGQQAAIRFWLKRGGEALLEELAKASGKDNNHDFAGVISSLTRNMKKAGGPKKWYQKHRDVNGKRVRRISDELVEPLKRAFKI